jgi:hypothetical protein
MIKNNSIAFLYFLIGFILVITSLIGITSVEIAIHDTYFIFSSQQIFLILGGCYLVFGGISWVFQKLNRPLNALLMWSHWIISSLAIIGVIVINWISTHDKRPRIYNDFSVYEMSTPISNLPDYNIWLTILISIGVFAQFLFIIALVLALSKRSNLNFSISSNPPICQQWRWLTCKGIPAADAFCFKARGAHN